MLFKEPTESTAPAVALNWGDILLKKRSWTEAKAGNAPKAEDLRQAWADAVEDFSEANPDHVQARATHEALVLEQARDLARAWRYEESKHLYEALIARRPNDAALRAELSAVLERQTLTSEELEKVRPGMEKEEVERLIGPPPPGWSRASNEVEGWYYSREGGGVAAVFFRNGKVFAVDFSGDALVRQEPAQTPDARP